jgi:hypothetical protein
MIDYSFMTQQQPIQPQMGQMMGQQMMGQPMQLVPIQVQPMLPPAANNIPGSAITAQNSGPMAEALMTGAQDPVATANKNQGSLMNKLGGQSGLSFILASLGQALSARDPNSWQYQMSTATKGTAQTQQRAKAQLIAALQQKMGQPDPMSAQPKQSGLGSMGSMKDSFSLLPGGYENALK